MIKSRLLSFLLGYRDPSFAAKVAGYAPKYANSRLSLTMPAPEAR